jgi:hypothetical protein
MADVLTVNKSLAEQATGSNNNTWGVDLNNTIGIIDTAFGGVTTISVTGVAAGNYALTLTQYTPPNIEFSGVLSGNLVYSVPPGVGGFWSVANACTGAFSLTIASNGGGTNVVIPQGQRGFVICDGTNVAAAQTGIVSANPVALVGLTAVNGTLGTFMTSDSAPALNQDISPDWTGIHTFFNQLNVDGTLTVEATGEIALAFGAVLSGAGALTVTVPTVEFTDNSTHAASTAFVQDNFSSSPGLGGNPTAATQAAGNNSTRIATTAFVQAAVAAAAVLAGNNTNGSISIGGIIINYGQLTTPGSSPTNVNYTTPYTTAVFAVVPYLINANQTFFVGSGFTTSLSHWTLNFGASAQVVGWIAIGQ